MVRGSRAAARVSGPPHHGAAARAYGSATEAPQTRWYQPPVRYAPTDEGLSPTTNQFSGTAKNDNDDAGKNLSESRRDNGGKRLVSGRWPLILLTPYREKRPGYTN